MAYIQFDNIFKEFSGKVQALRGISLSVEKGDLITLLGPSGCGKSTLLRCLAGLETVTSGKIYLDGVDITEFSPKQRAIGMVFQQYSLFPNLNVEQNVGFGLHIKKIDKHAISKKVKEMLDIVGLSDKIKQYPNRLSGGQQQRVALARALIMEPKVLLMDEPMSAIDALLRRNLQAEIRRIQRDLKITTVFVTHDQNEAMVMSDRIHLFNNRGCIEQSGTPVDLYTSPKTKFAASFIGHYNIVSAANFNSLTGSVYQCADVAVRPEVIGISSGAVRQNGTCCLKGVVRGSSSHGNIIRYTIRCDRLEFNVDILYDTARLYHEYQEVYITIPESGILQLDNTST
ncbi:MAG: ABC transporter ATP-binding protein [Treponema sp.]|jgi:putative spermidine/putrescine transport system ATP-binding protein|nr:ABC transporter ATP-binding protein [Treponema sp.]